MANGTHLWIQNIFLKQADSLLMAGNSLMQISTETKY